MRDFLKILARTWGWMLVAGPACATAQTPAPDVYLATLDGRAEHLRVGGVTNLTNRAGYDNQPFFLPDGSALLYTSARDGQTDIRRYDLYSGVDRALTRTPESEYSPTPVPGSDRIAVVRVEADSTQRLWWMQPDGTLPGPVFEDIAPVGYQAWATSSTVALFVLPSDSTPITLQVTEIGGLGARIVAENVGRSLHRIPGTAAISFLQRSTGTDTIMRLDPATGAVSPVTAAPGAIEDYTWTPDGTILTARDTLLLTWRPRQGWQVLANLSAAGLRHMTRLAVSPDGSRLALVADGRE